MDFYDNLWQCMTLYDNVWHCMTMYGIVWQCVSNVWQEWMTGHSMQRLRVPGSVAHWSDVDTGVFPLSILLALFFSSSFLLLVFPDIESFSRHILLALALCAFSGSFSVNIFTDYYCWWQPGYSCWVLVAFYQGLPRKSVGRNDIPSVLKSDSLTSQWLYSYK